MSVPTTFLCPNILKSPDLILKIFQINVHPKAEISHSLLQGNGLEVIVAVQGHLNKMNVISISPEPLLRLCHRSKRMLKCSRSQTFVWQKMILPTEGFLTLNAPITTKVVCSSLMLKWLRSLYGKQCGPRSDCSFRSSLFWVHAVCFYT